MKLKFVLSFLFALIFMASGCVASFGHLKYPSSTPLELGKTRDTYYLTMFGKPFSVEEKDTTAGKFELVHYQYVLKIVSPTRGGGFEYFRSLDLEFRDGVLNAYYFISNFEKERVVIDLEKLNGMRSGISKENDVLATLGQPNGMAFCPSYIAAFKHNCDKGVEVWSWVVLGKDQNASGVVPGEPIEKHVFIAFDKDGFVTNIESSQKKIQ